MRFPTFFPRVFHPPVYQGKKNPKNYFEGWYNKVIDAKGQNIWSFISGISYSDDPHAFIQVIEGRSGLTNYVRIPGHLFYGSRKKYHVELGSSVFSGNGMKLNIDEKPFEVHGELRYSGSRPFPQKLMAPGIMGWYSYAPFMECYHGVVSMHHDLEGSLNINGNEVDFSGGKGYIEKDWGKSMPTDWVWTQCNHFDSDREASLMISVARIPWRGSHFPGFLSFFRVNGEVYQFATYNRSRIDRLSIQPDALHLKLSGKKHSLQVYLQREKTGELKAPVLGEMNRKIYESLDAKVEVQLKEHSGKKIYEGQGMHAGLEIVGDVSQFL